MIRVTPLLEEAVQTSSFTQTVNGDKQHYIEGIFIQCNKPNRNKRYYPLEHVRPEVQRYVEKFIQTSRAMGELGHPNGGQINLDRVSHRITELRQEGTDFIGKALILDTPCGKIAKSLIEGGTQLGVSTRGFGNTKKQNGLDVVQGDFVLTTVDIVADPSAPDAFVQAIRENVEYYLNNGIIVERVVDNFERGVKGLTKSQITEGHLFEVVKNFLQSL